MDLSFLAVGCQSASIARKAAGNSGVQVLLAEHRALKTEAGSTRHKGDLCSMHRMLWASCRELQKGLLGLWATVQGLAAIDGTDMR